MLAVHVSRVWYKDTDGHFFSLDLLARVELEHATLVSQINLLLTCFVGQRKALSQGASGLRVGVYQKVALRVTLDLLLTSIEISIEARDEEHLLLNLVVTRYTKVQVYLLVIFPNITLVFLLVRRVDSIHGNIILTHPLLYKLNL